jgi:hypothetical protein
MTAINGSDIHADQVPRLTAELRKQAVEGPLPGASAHVADKLTEGGDIQLEHEEALATIEAVKAVGIGNDQLVRALRESLGVADPE